MRNFLKLHRAVVGPLAVVVATLILEILAQIGWTFPNPGVIILPVVILSTLLGGLASGLVAALLSVFYFLYLNHIPNGTWLPRMAPRGWTSITAISLAVPIAELFRRRLLAESQERFRTMANNIAQFAWMADEEGRIFWFNQRWYDYTGASARDIHTTGWQHLVHPDHMERVDKLLRYCIERGEMWEDTFPLKSRGGSYHWFLTRAVPVRDRKGKIQTWFGTNTDVTRQLEVETQLLQLKESLEAKVAERTAVAEGRAAQVRDLAIELTHAEQRERMRLAQVLHDDIQQLLVAARIQVEFATRTAGPSQNTAAAKDLISQAIQATRSLSKELAPPVLNQQALGAAIQWLASTSHEQYGIPVEVEVEEEGQSEEQWVRVLLFEVVRELLLNVAKHAKTDRVHIVLKRAHGEIRLLVEDFGTGFEVEHARMKQQAGGLGLFFIQQRIIFIGGQVELDSSPGKGTRIRITVPVTTTAPNHGGGLHGKTASETVSAPAITTGSE